MERLINEIATRVNRDYEEIYECLLKVSDEVGIPIEDAALVMATLPPESYLPGVEVVEEEEIINVSVPKKDMLAILHDNLSRMIVMFDGKSQGYHVPYHHDQLSKDVKYLDPEYSQIKMGCHHGQRKLLLTEIQFLHHFANAVQFVVYAGSAPCEHLPVLLKRFPHLKFILVDPNFHTFLHDYKYIYQRSNVVSDDHWKFILGQTKRPDRKPHIDRLFNAEMMFSNQPVNMITATREKSNPGLNDWERRKKTSVTQMLTSTNRVYVIQDYMTPELAQDLKLAFDISRASMVFISDIRTNFYGNWPLDLDYLQNDSLQMIFIKTLQPSMAMIKFHPPYFNLDDVSVRDHYHDHDAIWKIMESYGIQVLENYQQRQYVYFEPEIIYLQAWAPVSSTESRLIVGPKQFNQTRVYSHDDWDDQFMLFKSMRNYAYFNLYEPLKKIDPNIFYDGCLDCNLEIAILTESLIKGTEGSTMNMKTISQTLQTNPKLCTSVIKYHQEINSVIPPRNIIKCSSHGSLIRVPKRIYYYRMVPHPIDTIKEYIWQRLEYNDSGWSSVDLALVRDNKTPLKWINKSVFKLADNLPSPFEKMNDDDIRAWLLRMLD